MKNLDSLVPEPQGKLRGRDVLYHSYSFVENFNTSSKDFYVAVEQELQQRQVPGLEVSREEWHEGGPLSQKREYLRLTRERLFFDICAAPFGTGYFFSCRFCHTPAPISLIGLLTLGVCLMLLCHAVIRIFGFINGFFFLVIGSVILFWLLRNLSSLGLGDLDLALMKTPIIGPVYERFFRPDTYYRQDTKLMYLETVPAAVQKIVEKVTGANGVKLAPAGEKPALQGLAEETINA